MARGRAKLEWDQTSLLWCLTANINRDSEKKKEPFVPADIHPYLDEEEKPADAEQVKAARDRIKGTMKTIRLSNGKFRNRGWASFSQADH